MNPSESGTEDTPDPYAMRSVAGQAEVIANVDHAYGRKLDALASMRDRAYHELTELMPTSRSFGFSNALLVMLLGHAIGVLDAARILMEHGYGRHALGFIRTLVDLEIDALLVTTGGAELLERYPAYERWETAITGARGLYTLNTEDPEVLEGIRFRVADLTHALEEMGVDVSEIDDTDLVGALEEFGRHALQRPYPRSWRDHLNLDDLLDIVAPAHVRIFDPGVEGPDPDAFQAAVDQFKRDYKLGYGQMSGVVHASPRTLARSVELGKDGQIESYLVGGSPEEVDLASGMAGLTFLRIRRVVASTIGFDGDEDAWQADLATLREYGK